MEDGNRDEEGVYIWKKKRRFDKKLLSIICNYSIHSFPDVPTHDRETVRSPPLTFVRSEKFQVFR